MASYTFGAFIEVESSPHSQEPQSIPIAPQKALPRTYHSVPEPLGLDKIEWNVKATAAPGPPGTPSNATPSGYQTPIAFDDLEMSRSPSPHQEHEGVEMMQSFSNPPQNRFRVLSTCLVIFAFGISDSASGVLLPSIEKFYGVGYAIVSLIFVTNATGWIFAAFFVDALRLRLGRAKTLMLGQALMACGYLPIVSTAPFPAIVAGYFLLGLGMAINLAMGNTFIVNLHNSTRLLGIMHGAYGIGGVLGPIMATAMVEMGGLPWSRYYLLPLVVTLFNLLFAGWSFWNFESEAGASLFTALELTASQAQNGSLQAHPQSRFREQVSNMRKAFKSKTVILGALFIFAYQGAEVSISGWVISFLISNRHGNPSHVGYVTAGFWGGITLGRFLLSHPAHKIGEKIFVYIMSIGAIVFELLVWQVPNIIGEAVALAIVGLLLGPIYPCATVIFSRAINRKEQISSMSVISAFGSSGGAVAPFTTGILAQAAGTFVLHPIAIGLFAIMLGCWYWLPNPRKRTE